MDAIIRKAESADASAIWDIRNAAILARCKGHYPDDLLARWTAGPMTDRFVRSVAQKFFVGTIERSVACTGIIDCTTGHLDAIFVRPDLMGKGLGTQMLSHLENIALNSDLKKLTLDSTLNAAEFYRKRGFVGDLLGTYRSPRGFSLDCIPMEKMLGS